MWRESEAAINDYAKKASGISNDKKVEITPDLIKDSFCGVAIVSFEEAEM